jgi:hypothetical protein
MPRPLGAFAQCVCTVLAVHQHHHSFNILNGLSNTNCEKDMPQLNWCGHGRRSKNIRASGQ